MIINNDYVLKKFQNVFYCFLYHGGFIVSWYDYPDIFAYHFSAC